LACPARSDIVLGNTMNGSIGCVLKNRDNAGWRKVSACRGCWLECTVGVSMILNSPLKEVSQLLGLWRKRKN